MGAYRVADSLMTARRQARESGSKFGVGEDAFLVKNDQPAVALDRPLRRRFDLKPSPAAVLFESEFFDDEISPD
jgi:hypothetical protein